MAKKKRAFIRADNSAAFDCPNCGKTGIIKLETQVKSSTPIRARYRCPCGRSHVVFLEKRAHVRREVELAAELVVGSTRQAITIRNLSRFGLMFEQGDGIELKVGDRAVVEFQLEHAERTPFVKRITVRHVSPSQVGAEFTANGRRPHYDPVYDLALAQMRSE